MRRDRAATMMRLSTLWRVLRTLDATGARNTIAESVVERWEHDDDTLRLIRASANFVWRFQAGGLPRFLRFADSSERSRVTIEAEVDFVKFLGNRGVLVALPVPSRS